MRTVIALKELRMLCNLHNGFYGEPEKRWAVDTLRALREKAHERYDPQEGSAIDVADALRTFPIYTSLDGQGLQAVVTPTHRRWFRDHWREHRIPSNTGGRI